MTTNDPDREITEILSDPELVVKALELARQKAIADHRQAGIPLAVSDNGKVILVDADKLESASEG